MSVLWKKTGVLILTVCLSMMPFAGTAGAEGAEMPALVETPAQDPAAELSDNPEDALPGAATLSGPETETGPEEADPEPAADTGAAMETDATEEEAAAAGAVADISDWSGYIHGGADGEAVLEDTVVKQGARSLKIVNRTPVQPQTYITLSQTVEVKPNTTYELSVWVKGEDVRGTWFGGGPGWNFRRHVPSGTYDWQLVIATYTTGADETSFQFRILSEDVTGSVWFDDLAMIEVGTADNLLQNAGFEKELQTVLLNGFDDAAQWKGSRSDAGQSSGEAVAEPKTEGEAAVKVTYQMNPGADAWVNFTWDPETKLDLGTTEKLLVDIYPASQTNAGDEPLVVKISGDAGVIHERTVGRLTANQWNTVEIDLRTVEPSKKERIGHFNFYIYGRSGTIENRSELIYVLDNLRMLRKAQVEPVTADPPAGEVPPGTKVELATATPGAVIYYTVDGSDPKTSPTRRVYGEPVEIQGPVTIRAYASVADMDDSPVSSFTYTPGTGVEGEALLDLRQYMASLGSGKYAPVYAESDSGILLDGSLDEWEAYTGLFLPSDTGRQVVLGGWGGNEDVSANVQFAYNEEGLFLGIQVTDNAHTAYAGEGMWTGDGIQFAVSADGFAYGPEYGLALVDGEPQVWRWSAGSAELGIEAVQLAAVQDGNLTAYEAFVPWKALFAEAGPPDVRIPFTLLVNDNDGEGRRGWIEWTGGIGRGKDPLQFASLDLLDPDAKWDMWVEGPKEIMAGETAVYQLYVPNYSGRDLEIRLSSPDTGMDRTLTLPGGMILRKTVEFAPGAPGEQEIRFIVEEPASGASGQETVRLKVHYSAEDLYAMFDAIEARMPELDRLLDEAETRGLKTDYERVNRTVIHNFLAYGRDDVEQGQAVRALYVAEELERLMDEAAGRLQAYLDGNAVPWHVPRYVTGSERPDIRGYSFLADQHNPEKNRIERGPVFFTGYGHFGQVRQDIPQFADYGINIIQIEIGPRSVILSPDSLLDWTVNRAGGVQAEAKVDRTVAHSGNQSLAITNATPKQPHVYINVMQRVPVKPNTTYHFRAWVKGENVQDVWFPGGPGWVHRQKFPEGTFDWTEVTYEYTTGENETSFDFLILSENTIGQVWIDDVSMTEAGSSENLLRDPGFEWNQLPEGKDYIISDTAIRDDIQQVLKQAAEHNIAVNLLISPHYFPDWALEKWPELKSNNNGFIRFAIDEPKAREIIEDYLRTLIPLVKDVPSLHSITLSNEPVYQSALDPQNLPEWHAYLEELYHGDIAELNRIYGTNYQDFSEVAMPARPEGTPVFYDWVMFNNDLFSSWHQWMADIIHEMAPDLPVHAKIMAGALNSQGALTWGIDPEQFADLSQINGNDNWNYYGQGGDGFLTELRFYDLQASLKKAPLFNSEDHLIRDGDTLYIPEQADHVRSVLWQGAIHGRTASTIWVWERTYDVNSDFQGSIMHRPDAAAAVGRTNLDLNRLAEEVTAFQEAEADAVILYSIPSMVYAPGYYEALAKAYEAVSYSGLKAGFVSERQVQEKALNGAKLLIIPNATHVQAETLEEIRRFVRHNGKAVILGDGALQFDEHDQPLPAEVRDEIYAKAAVLDPSTGPNALRDALWPLFGELGLNGVVLVDAATGEPVYGVEWRSVMHKGRLLVNIDNYNPSPKQVYISVNGQRISAWNNLLHGGTVPDSIELQPLEPYLLSEIKGNGN